MQSLWFLWDIFINVLEFYFSYLLLRKQLGISKGKKRWVVAGTIVLIVLQTLMNYYGVNSRIVMVCMYILGLVYAFFLFNGTPAMRIMWGSAPTIVFIMANLLVYIIVTSINSFNMQAALTPSLFRLFPTSLYISFCFLMFFGMSKFSAQYDLIASQPAMVYNDCYTFGNYACGPITGVCIKPGFYDI